MTRSGLPVDRVRPYLLERTWLVDAVPAIDVSLKVFPRDQLIHEGYSSC